MRHYKLDGELVKNIKCCDYLLLNDSCKRAYYIELKGRDLEHAIEQVEAGEQICKEFIGQYTSLFRIVTSKTRTHGLKSQKYRHFLNVKGKDSILVKTNEIEESL